MYKYIKGKEVLMEEHMLSATELAKQFGLYTVNGNPNGLLVSNVLADYVKNNNLNISDYYYPHGHGVMRVYPSIVYYKALNDFVFDLEENTEYNYVIEGKSGKSRINFKHKRRKDNGIISITERRKTNGRK
jgi:hypothetical protein